MSFHRSSPLMMSIAVVLACASQAMAHSTGARPTQDQAALLRDVRHCTLRDPPQLTRQQTAQAVLSAMSGLDRADFVPPDQRARAYVDEALPIGFDQTISSPCTVALMIAAADVRAGSRVLEIGTGSGYQAAVLSRLGAYVFSMELVEPLATRARDRLSRLNLHHIEIRIGDGFAGWPEAAPFDAIIVTAGAAAMPAPLLSQVRPGGRVVMPLGPSAPQSQLVVATRRQDGSFSTCSLGPAMFVPLMGTGYTGDRPGLYDRTLPACVAHSSGDKAFVGRSSTKARKRQFRGVFHD